MERGDLIMTGISSYDADLLWVMLHQSRDAIFKLRERELRGYGITATQASILFTIVEIGGNPTAAEISRHLIRESHSVSTILSRMEKQGLVTKENDIKRKNLVRVSLTEKGRYLYQEAAKRKSILKIISKLPSAECEQLILSLQKLRDMAVKDLGIEDLALIGY